MGCERMRGWMAALLFVLAVPAIAGSAPEPDAQVAADVSAEPERKAGLRILGLLAVVLAAVVARRRR